MINIFQKNKLTIFTIALFLLFFFYYKSIVTKLPIRYFDEEFWVGRSYFFELLIKKDFKNPLWNSVYFYDQSPVTFYVYGLSLYPYYLKYKAQSTNINKDFAMFLIDHNYYEINGYKYEKYKKQNNSFTNWNTKSESISNYELITKYGNNIRKTINLIYIVRTTNAVILALTVILVYYITLILFGYSAAFLSTIFYGFNFYIINNGLLAGSEALFLLFFLLSFLLILLIFTQKKNTLYLTILFSVSTAFLAQTKINGLIILILFYLLLFVKLASSLVKNNKLQTFHCIKQLLISLTSFILCFMVINPFLYKNPIRSTLIIYNWRWETTKNFMKLYPESALTSFGIRLYTIYKNFLTEKITIFNNWLAVINIDILFFCLGLFAILLKIIRKGIFSKSFLFLFSFVFFQLSMTFYLMLNWSRYFILLAPFFIIFKALGVEFIINKDLLRKFVSYFK